MYVSGGKIFCYGSEEGFDANTEGGAKLFIQSGACFMAVGATMGALENNAQLSQTCKQASVSGNTWYALYSGSSVAFAAYTPTFSGGGGGGYPGGGSSSTKTMVVSAPSTPALYKGVTGSGTSFWTGKGYSNASGGSSVTLSNYSGGGW